MLTISIPCFALLPPVAMDTFVCLPPLLASAPMMLMVFPIFCFALCAVRSSDASDASIVCCHAAAHGNDAHDVSDCLLSLFSPAAVMLMML